MPAAVDGMSLWQFGCLVAGWNRAQGAEPDVEAPSRDEFEALMNAVM